MATKTKTVFVCQECGAQSLRWQGRCTECNKWNTLVEEVEFKEPKLKERASYEEEPRSIFDINADEGSRIKTKIEELDRILGGGIVPGSVILVGGEPGIGKSTLLLQMSDSLSEQGGVVLYVSGEESVKQTKLRANRIGASSRSLYIVSQTNLDLVKEYIKKLSPSVVVIDSIQVLYTSELESAAGSVSQVRNVASELVFIAKSTGISIFLVGHVTKDGTLAGPRVLEHIVDTVLYFEGERFTTFRILRAVKNRFGSTNEIGVFQMGSTGLEQVANPSELLLAERPRNASGSIVVSAMEGTRPLLVEVQALVSRSGLALPRRRASGIDANRLMLLAAVLEKKVGLNLANQDIFVNVAGGITLKEPASDLGIAIAVASSLKEKPTRPEDIAIGEVGLAGEVRTVSQIGLRVSEAERMGFKRAIISRNNSNELRKKDSFEIIGVSNTKEAIELALG